MACLIFLWLPVFILELETCPYRSKLPSMIIPPPRSAPLLGSLAICISLCCGSGRVPLQAAIPADIQKSIAAIQAVGPEGKGNLQAGTAWKTLSNANHSAIVPLLLATNGASPMAQNWFRSAIDAIVSRELKAGKALPLTSIGAYLLDTRNSPQGRRLAYELIAESDPATAAKLLPGMLDDPSPQLRRDAVQGLIDQAAALNSTNKPAATLLYRQALNSARDADQIKRIAGQLKELGAEVDLPRHFGFLTHWKVIAPFDNTKREGYDTVFPPEEKLDLNAKYQSKDGKEIGWQDLAVTDEYGMLDFNPTFGLLKEVTGYAYTEMDFDAARPAELRVGCKNAWKIWFNGKLLFARDEYHRGMQIDQYSLPIQLKQGKNTLLMKLCQNEQTQNWTVEWQAQVRICDSTGTAILASDRLPTPKAEKPTRRALKQ
jgi:hypothetical protein